MYQTYGLYSVLAYENFRSAEKHKTNESQHQLDKHLVGKEKSHGHVIELPLLLSNQSWVSNGFGNFLVLLVPVLQVHHESSADQGGYQR